VVDETNEGQEDGLTGRRLDDGRLAYARGIQVDVGTFFGGIFFDVQIENLDNVADEVWQLAGWGMSAGSWGFGRQSEQRTGCCQSCRHCP
jgi:hypothetical protein